jgi:23S rRNA pseudouridine1911/1915/1917 synthase
MPKYAGFVEDEGLRLDRYVAERLQILSRSQVKSRRLRAKCCGREVKLSRLLKKGDFLELEWNDPEPVNLIPEDIPLNILYENSYIVVVDKAQGMAVHPGAGRGGGTLANALYYRRLQRRFQRRLQRRLQEQPDCAPAANPRLGIVHRLDKDTSGVIIAAYDDESLAFLSGQFKARQVKKAYRAIVRGRPPQDSGVIETRIVRSRRDRKKFTVSDTEGKPSLTRYRVIRCFGAFSFLSLYPKTGRTHQIRVHLESLGCPVLGDPVYGGRDPLFPDATLMLHARSLSIRTPPDGDLMTFGAPLPARFKAILRTLEGK